jgi:malonyl-CoA/methylmalonyl-CoA synthetase
MPTLTASLLAAARRNPERASLVQPDGPTLTNGQLLDFTGQLANALAAHGVRPGDRVAVQAEKSVEGLCLYLAALRAGAVFLPLNTAYTPAEVEYFLRDADPAIFVCDSGRRDLLAAGVSIDPARIVCLDGPGGLAESAAVHPRDFHDIGLEDDDLAAILYTSGTTGRSKGAMITCGNLLSNAETLVDVWRITGEDVLLHALPIYHTHGLFVALNTLLLAGGRIDFHRRFDADVVIARLPDATLYMGVPTHYTRLLDHPGLADAARGMRLFISGSAPLLAATHRQFHAITGHHILERYGMTETGMNTSNPYAGERRPGTVGLPLPGVELRIADEHGAPVPEGGIGVIELRGPNVFKGYWGMPEKTASEFRPDGFFITGDVGKIDGDGYVHIVGRQKDLVITGGLNVYPKEVETLIDSLPEIEESAVIGLPHADFGEAVTAIVVPRQGCAPDEAAILAALDGKLARFKQPKRVICVPELPRNSMGKVQKAELRQRFSELYRATD